MVHFTVEALINCNDDAPPTTFGPIDVIAAGAPTGATTIFIEGIETGTGGGSIFIDNVSLIASDCIEPADCDVVVTANYNCDGTCEDAIAGTILTDSAGCPSQGSDFSGIEVIITDFAGMPVVGSPAITDAMGNYSLPGPFPCGDYQAELNF